DVIGGLHQREFGRRLDQADGFHQGVAGNHAVGAGASRTPSTMKRRVVDSKATAPEVTPRSTSAPTRRANGLSCSFQGRTSPPTAKVSRIEGSSKAGVTTTTSPRAGITAAVVRSERCHWTPVK